MFKVLIVDEEVYVVFLIQELINWEAYGMQVIDIANDGTRALQLVREKKPDVVIVNVQMKGSDGIPFIESVREFDQRVRLIVISGCRQFDNAKIAMKSHAEDYLLKPINKSELEEALLNIRYYLQRQYMEEKFRNKLERELKKSKEKIQADLLRDLLEGKLCFDYKEMKNINMQYLTNFTATEFLLLSLNLEHSLEADRKEYFNQLLAEIRAETSSFCREMIFCSEYSYVICMCNLPESDVEQLKKYLRTKLQSWNDFSTSGSNDGLTVCMGDVFGDLSELQLAYKDLSLCIRSRPAIGIGRLITKEELVSTVLEETLLVNIPKLFSCLKEADMKQLKIMIRELFSYAYYRAKTDSLIYYRIYEQLITVTHQYFLESGLLCMEISEYEKMFYDQFYRASSYQEMSEAFYELLNEILKNQNQSTEKIHSPAVRTIKRYIEKHYAQEIKVSDLAELVNLNADYLSRIFKKEEHLCLLEYLHQYRIEMAKKMLMNVRNNVDDVAYGTGFKNTDYFYRVFKRMVGMPPSEYRKRVAELPDYEKEDA